MEQSTYAAGCDVCGYVAETQASDDENAMRQLAIDLSEHNLDEHGQMTNVEEILEPVKNKMEKN